MERSIQTFGAEGSGVISGDDSSPAIWPALVDVYQEQGFETGYHRGVSDVLAAFLEATEQFVDVRPENAVETRRLLHEFAGHLEKFLDRPHPHFYFEDGSGI
jgi:hypothetical protein